MSNNSSGATVRDVEQRIETLLDRIRLTSKSTSHDEALGLLEDVRHLIAPPRFRSTVQLEEEGRKKRSTAAASNWKFETGEIVIYFEPGSESVQAESPAKQKDTLLNPSQRLTDSQDRETVSPAANVRECCAALAEAERSGKQFIALKWFRDLALPGLPHAWTRTAEDRQAVLSQAIDSGAIVLRRIPNPKSPMHPTTTVTLNRSSAATMLPSRFSPVPITGEPASATLLLDRGNY